MSWSQLESQAVELFRAVAPCLMAQTEVRLVDMRRLPGVGLAYHLGFVNPNLDVWARDADAIDDPPAGRFIAIAYNRMALEANHAGEDLPCAFIELALHELAHVIELNYPAVQQRRAHTPDMIAEDLELLAAKSITPRHAMTLPERQSDDHTLLWTHTERFIRVALHLLHRARVADPRWRRAGLAEVVGRVTGRSEPWRYRAALGDEPERMTGKSFAAILETPTPDAFTALWASDLEAAEQRRNQTNPFSLPGDRIMSFFETLRSFIGARKRQQAIDFAGLVRAVADGEPIDPKTAAEALETAGKSPDDLQAAVEHFQGRRQKHAALKKIRATLAERPAIEAKIAAETEKLEAARRACTAAVQPLHERLKNFDRLFIDAKNLERALRASAPADATEKADDARKQIGILQKRVDDLTRRAYEAEQYAQTEATIIKRLHPERDTVQIERRTREKEGAEARAADARAEVDTIIIKLDALRESAEEASAALLEI